MVVTTNGVAASRPEQAQPVSEFSLTEQLAHALVAIKASTIDSATIAHAKRFVLDWLGSAVAGTVTPPGAMLQAEAADRGVGPTQVLGLPQGRDAATAALVNGGLSHIVEMDDLDRGSVVHPGTVVIPAALAMAQDLNRSGKDFLTAVVVGYDAAIRVGDAVGRSHYAFWQNTATCGAFGSAAAAGWLLGLDRPAMTWALGNAGSVAGGLWQFNRDGAMTKHLHAGQAAANGLVSARLAARGFTGAREILEGPQGFFAAMSTDARPERVIAGLPESGKALAQWKIAGVSMKPHASCRHTHPAVDAALALRRELGDVVRQATGIRVATYGVALAITDEPRPRNVYQAKFSLQYTVAQALNHGRVGLDDFADDRLADPVTQRLMARTALSIDPVIDTRYPAAWMARVEIDLEDGTCRVVEVDAPKGDPGNPLTDDELTAKYQDLAGGTAYESFTAQTLAAIAELEHRSTMPGFLPAPTTKGV